jgi:hypothetical protein
MGALMFGAGERDVAPPLIGHDSRSEAGANNGENLGIEEECRLETRRVERDGKEMAIRSAIRLMRMVFEPGEEPGPEGLAAGLYGGLGEVSLKNAVSVPAQFEKLSVRNHAQAQ